MDSFINATPKITVLMPVYNCELYVNAAIDSILNQSCTDFEFLILDDASTDETVSIIKSYKDSRIQLIEKPLNTGYTNSLNMGLQVAKGKYIARMDGDDISLPERFARQVAYLDANPEVVVCGTSYEILGENKQTVIPESHNAIKLALLKSNCIAHPSVLIRKKILDEFSIIYDASKEPSEDYAMWVRLLSVGKLHNLQEVLLKYRIHSTSVSHKRVEDQEKRAIEIKLQLLNNLDIILDYCEREILEKCFKKKITIDFGEIKIFKQVHEKLLISNADCFFEPIGFTQFLNDFEADVLRKCFLRQNKYSPSVYLEYLKTKKEWNVRLTTIQEIKLAVKSMIFWKM
ncbi:glycosyltransferase family 2 protein [Flavobacterium sp. ZS1P14]|uniref:glycosyltransferase family 2 protein n=1 Tax=Flavobacterium sp. ZS1P14 TaxID=3401729 RepID=UPI003AADC23F